MKGYLLQLWIKTNPQNFKRSFQCKAEIQCFNFRVIKVYDMSPSKAGQKRTWGFRWTPSWTRTSKVSLPYKREMVLWASLGKMLLWGRWWFPTAQHCWGHTWSSAYSYGLLSTREIRAYWRESNKGLWRWWRDWSISPVKPGSFSVVPSARIRSNGHKLKYRKFHLNIRKSLFTLTVVKYLSKLPREVVEPQSSEIFKKQPTKPWVRCSG